MNSLPISKPKRFLVALALSSLAVYAALLAHIIAGANEVSLAGTLIAFVLVMPLILLVITLRLNLLGAIIASAGAQTLLHFLFELGIVGGHSHTGVSGIATAHHGAVFTLEPESLLAGSSHSMLLPHTLAAVITAVFISIAVATINQNNRSRTIGFAWLIELFFKPLAALSYQNQMVVATRPGTSLLQYLQTSLSFRGPPVSL